MRSLPRWSETLLRAICPKELFEQIEGDLIEIYNYDVRTVGKRRAKLKLVMTAIRFLRPGILMRNSHSLKLNDPTLLSNWRFGLRYLSRQKLNTTLHVVGLTLALSVCLLIGLFLGDELRFDKHYEKSDRIYRVNSVWKESNKQFNLYATPIPLADAIRAEMTGIENVVMVRPQFRSVVEINSQKLCKQERILIAEPGILDIFDIEILRGDRSALSKPYQALLNETTAVKYFGSEDPIGKSFRYRNKFIITVAGVFRDMPSATHLPAAVLLSYVANEAFLDNGDTWRFGDLPWTTLAASTYIVVDRNTDVTNLESQLKAIADRNINSAPTLDKTIRGDFEMQALTDIHFDTKRFGGGPWIPATNSSWLWFFGGIGIVVLLLACINFLNLSTAQALARSREVGVRKAIGARRSQLVWQFLTEAFIITLIAGAFAIVISLGLLPTVNTILDKQITFDLFQSYELWIALILFILLTSLLSGIYPAWFIARFDPVEALKSRAGTGSANTSVLRKALIVVQFTMSAGLLIAVLLMAQQAGFLRNADLGFEKDNIIRVEIGSHEKMQSFANALLQLPGVNDVSFSRTSPISDDHWWNTISETETSDRRSVCAIYGDDHFYNVYGLQLLSGRVPSQVERSTDTSIGQAQVDKVVVNEKLLQELNLGSPHEAVGKHFWWGGDTEISGVVADFNTEPLKYAISPTLIYQEKETYSHANIKIESSDIPKTLASIETAWKIQFPGEVYEYTFVDSQMDSYYKSENRLYTLFSIFSGLAILISCIGLWGLVTYTARQRTKEIGIRKVLGASVQAILTLLAMDFLSMVLIAFAIASPLTYYFMNEWLSDFAFHIDIGWVTFVTAAISLLTIAVLTVSIQTLKAALTNPVDSLKTE